MSWGEGIAPLCRWGNGHEEGQDTLCQGQARELWARMSPGSPLTSWALPITSHTTNVKTCPFHTSNSTPFHCVSSRRLCASLGPAHKTCVHSRVTGVGPTERGTPRGTNLPTQGPANNFWFGLKWVFLQGEQWELFPTLGNGIKNGHWRLVRFKGNVRLTRGCSCWNLLPDGVVLFR